MGVIYGPGSGGALLEGKLFKLASRKRGFATSQNYSSTRCGAATTMFVRTE